MTDFNEATGDFLRVDVVGGCWYAIAAHEEADIRKAIIDYRERGIDCLVEVEDRWGDPVAFIASVITGFRRSTPQNRAAAHLEEIKEDEWLTEFRKAHAAKEWEA